MKNHFNKDDHKRKEEIKQKSGEKMTHHEDKASSWQHPKKGSHNGANDCK